MRQLACICPQCNRRIFEDELPTPDCPGCGKHIANIVWRSCPRCEMPTDASQPRCQNCSAAFDSLFDDEVIGDAERLFVTDEGLITGVVSKDTAESPWSTQEDVKALMIDQVAVFTLPVSTDEVEAVLNRLIVRTHYWRWIFSRGGTAIPVDNEPDRMEMVAERVEVLGALAFPLQLKMAGIIRSN